MRTAAFTLVLAALAAPAADPPALPLAPRLVTVTAPTAGAAAAEIAAAAGVPVSVPAAFAGKAVPVAKGVPFWAALDRLAAAADLRVAVRDEGRAVELVPRGGGRETSSVSGPFRVAAREVVGRALLAEGLTVYEVKLDVHWEPRYPVFRIESYPHITRAHDDRGVLLQPQPAGGKTQPGGAVHAASVKLGGVTRAATKIGELSGTFTVTASEKLIPFSFDVTAAKGKATTAEKVRAELTGWQKDDDTWIAEIDLTYPPELPEFESFEATAFTAANRARLVGPGGKRFAPDSQAVAAVGRRVSATYYFKEDGAGPAGVGRGWAVELDAASTPVEFRVPFTLRDIPLP